MKKYLIILFLITSLLIISYSSYASLIILQPGPEGKDTWIWDSEDFSHGDWGEMRVNDSSDYLQYGLIEFDISSIPTNVTINRATLGLYRYSGLSDDGLLVNAYQVLNSWTEDVTWTTRPSFNSIEEDSTTIYGNGWYTWDLTGLTQEWIDGSTPNYGVALFDSGVSFFQRFVTSDNMEASQPFWDLAPTDPSLRPYFKIDYTVHPVPEPITLLLTGSLFLVLFGLGLKMDLKERGY